MPPRLVGGGGSRYLIVGARLYCKCMSFSVVSLYFDVLTLPDQAHVTLQMTVFPI